MRRRRLPLGVLVPAALAALVGTLAVLQYRWLGQVSEAERDQLRTTLTQRAGEFADDFDREIGQLYVTLQTNRDEIATTPSEAFAERLESWRRSARFPELVSGMFLASEDGTLRAWSGTARAFVAADWPEPLLKVRERLWPATSAGLRGPGGTVPQTARILRFSAFPVMSDVPAVVIPIGVAAPPPAPPPPPPARTGGAVGAAPTTRLEVDASRTWPASAATLDRLVFSLHEDRTYLIALLDSDYLRLTMLPSLADLHFPASSSERYRVSVVDEEQQTVMSRHLPPGTGLDAAHADVTASFFGLRLETLRSGPGRLIAWNVTTRDKIAAPAEVTARLRPESVSVFVEEHAAAAAPMTEVAAAGMALSASSGWRLLIQHADGSLDAAVANARRRNLWLSFSILGVLFLGVGLVVLNAQRSERLARQQMDFVATVSHELRTPLAVIRSAAQNLSAGVVHDAGQARKYGDLIDTEGRRLTDMVEQVLEYAGLAGGRRVRTGPVDLRRTIEDVVGACRSLVEPHGIQVDVTLAPDVPLVDADEEAMRRAVGNLVTNAVKYAADGGWIGVSVTPVQARGRTEVQVTVSDRGPGIDPLDLPHVFEPFYRGRRAHDRQIHGNGLGLSLVRRIMETHGGRALVKSVPGQGTTFTLTLPAVRGDAAAEPVGQPEPRPAGHA